MKAVSRQVYMAQNTHKGTNWGNTRRPAGQFSLPQKLQVAVRGLQMLRTERGAIITQC